MKNWTASLFSPIATSPQATGHVRSLRGGAQSHLLRASDGQLYVVKFRNNPQGQRILANEWIASAVFQYLGLKTPEVTPIWIDEDFIRMHPECGLRLGSRGVPIQPGYHFASRYVGTEQKDCYEYVPDMLLSKVRNLDHFIGALVADKWLTNADARQCVYFHHDDGFYVHMIDNGYAFNGPHWEFVDTDLSGLYCRPIVYDNLRSIADVEPWLARVESMPRRVLTDAYETIPTEWLSACEHAQLVSLLDKLYRRRTSLRDDLPCLFARRAAHFPAWQRAV